MTQPSDETFLDEMAAKAHESPHTSQFVVSESDVLRLVALARRAPALTCGTCQDGVSEELFCEVDVMWTKATFFCKLHSPLPAAPAPEREP